MEIAIISDQKGVDTKNFIINYLIDKDNVNVIDLGSYTDTKEITKHITKEIKDGNIFGIIISKTGIDSCISCNRVKDIRAAFIVDINSALISKEEDNINILCLGRLTTDPDKSINIIDVFIG